MVGVIPRHLHAREVGHPRVTQLHVVDNMHVRKELMFRESDAFAVLPGGLGTMDETFEIITWKQLGLHDKPIIIVNIQDYWSPFLALFDHIAEKGFAGPEPSSLARWRNPRVHAKIDAIGLVDVSWPCWCIR